MPTNVKPNFFDQLRASGLLKPEQLKELADLPEAKQADPRPLARQVFQRGWLSKHQINLVVAGRAKELLVGPYILVDRLGEGGMGTVFKARHRHMSRVVALKIIRKERLANPDAVERFYREAQAAAQLAHPNIVLAFDAGQDGGTHYLSMEFVDGPDLARLVRESGPLPVAQACEYVRQAALGLQHAHERGIIHRDIKPHNLLLTHEEGPGKAKRPVVKVLDMGLALRGGSDKERAITQTGAIIGTPDYIAPEQAINSRAADIRADLYSLGCTLYFLLTGRAPFLGESLAHVLLQHQMEEAAPLEQLRADIPPAVAAVVKKLMAKRPQDRFQTPAELVQTLDALAQGKTDAIQTAPAPSAAGLRPRTDPEVDVFWNTIVEGSDEPAKPAPDGTDVDEAGERGIKGQRGKRTAAKSKGILTKKQTLALAVGGGILAFLALLTVVIAGGSGGDNKDTDPDRDDQVVQKDPDDKKDDRKKDVVEKPPEPVPGSEARLFKGHIGPVPCVAFSADGRLAVSGGGQDATVRVWNVTTGEELCRFTDLDGVRSIALAPQGRRVLVTIGNRLREFDVDTRKEVGRERRGGLLSPAGQVSFAVETMDGQTWARFRGTADGNERNVFLLPGRISEPRIAFATRDDSAVFGGKQDGSLFACSFPMKRIRRISVGEAGLLAVACSPDGRVALVTTEQGSLHLVDLVNDRVLPSNRDANRRAVRAVAFTPDGRRALYAGDDQVLVAWDVAPRKAVTQLAGHTGTVVSLAVSPDGRHALSGSADGTVRLWDLTTLPPAPEPPPITVVQPGSGQPTGVVTGGRILKANGATRTLAMMSDGRRLAVVTQGGMLEVWALPEGRLVSSWPADTGIQGTKLELSPDGRQAVWFSPISNTLHGMDLTTGKVRPSARIASGQVMDLAISPDGRRALTAGGTLKNENGKRVDSNTEVHFWDLEKMQHVAAWAGHSRLVRVVAFADGNRAISSGEDGIRVWDVARGKETKFVPAGNGRGGRLLSRRTAGRPPLSGKDARLGRDRGARDKRHWERSDSRRGVCRTGTACLRPRNAPPSTAGCSCHGTAQARPGTVRVAGLGRKDGS